MVGIIRRLAIAGAAAFVPVAFVTVVSPGVSNAVDCGFGTVFDLPTNTCGGGTTSTPSAASAASAASLERRSHAVLLGGDRAPIPFVSLCTGI